MKNSFKETRAQLDDIIASCNALKEKLDSSNIEIVGNAVVQIREKVEQIPDTFWKERPVEKI